MCGEHPVAFQPPEDHEVTGVGDEDAVDASVGGAQRVVGIGRQRVRATQRARQKRARRSRGLNACAPARARTDEQDYLDTVPTAERHHLVQLFVGEQPDAAALADAVHGHVQVTRGVEDDSHGGRPLDRWDLDADLRAVREPLGRLRQVVRVAGRQAERGDVR